MKPTDIAMTGEIDKPTNYQNNPLHGLSLKNLLKELVDHYGFELLFAYLNINCFKTNPSIASSEKFLKKTDWAREKVEAFYLYQFKSLPKASSQQFSLPPRDRIIPEGQVPGEPAELSLEDAERLREEREQKAAEYNSAGGRHSGSVSERGGARRGGIYKSADNNRSRSSERSSSSSSSATSDGGFNPWGKSKN